jgi:hypothetical protein
MTTAFGVILGMLIEGHALDRKLSEKVITRLQSGELPFMGEGRFSSPDALLGAGYNAIAAVDPDIRIEPAWKVSLVYGMPCAVYHQFPAAYYLAARFSSDFESAVLHAVNGGGQNQARAMLTGALAGAQNGLSGIPQRFIDGLENNRELLQSAWSVGNQMVADQESAKDLHGV